MIEIFVEEVIIIIIIIILKWKFLNKKKQR